MAPHMCIVYLFWNIFLINLMFPGWDLIEMCDLIVLTFQELSAAESKYGIKVNFSTYIIPLFVDILLYSYNEILKYRQNSTGDSLLFVKTTNMRNKKRRPHFSELMWFQTGLKPPHWLSKSYHCQVQIQDMGLFTNKPWLTLHQTIYQKKV